MRIVESPIVSFSGVNKVFNPGSAKETVALRDINLAVETGSFVSVIGPSGCGKSTLLRLVGDLIQPTTGEVQVKGKPARQARLNQDYGIVFQAPVLFEWRSILKNIQLPLELRGAAPEARDRRARELLGLVELTGFEKHYPWQLSGGMQQRASIARALAIQPELLLMDEPFGALDEMTRERMNNELLHIWSSLERMTVMFVTHSISEAVYLSSRVVVLSPRPGRIAEIIDIDLPRPRGPETRDLDDFFHLSNRVRHALREGVQT